MAHQAHNIPWACLTSNLRWSPGYKGNNYTCDFHFQSRPNQANDLNHFAVQFIENLEEHSKCERKKYSDTYEAPASDEIIVSDKTAAKIFPTVSRWLVESNWLCPYEPEYLYSPGWCPSVDAKEGVFCASGIKACDSRGDPRCRVLPLHERKMAAFCREVEHLPSENAGFRYQSPGVYNKELVETLILYGEMETILRACAHPDVAIASWRHADSDLFGSHGFKAGWDQVYKKAMAAYITFNVIYHFPETWDNDCGRDKTRDYRNTRLYQTLVDSMSLKEYHETPVVTYPHNQMLGIDYPTVKQISNKERSDHIKETTRRFAIVNYDNYRELYGRVSYDDFMLLERINVKNTYDPSGEDIVEVQSTLQSKGLPIELALEVLEFADYSPKQRLKVPHDPFHPENRERLAKYISYCWQILVRCHMLGKELGVDIKWKEAVVECIGQDLWSYSMTHPCKRLVRFDYEVDYEVEDGIFFA